MELGIFKFSGGGKELCGGEESRRRFKWNNLVMVD